MFRYNQPSFASSHRCGSRALLIKSRSATTPRLCDSSAKLKGAGKNAKKERPKAAASVVSRK